MSVVSNKVATSHGPHARKSHDMFSKIVKIKPTFFTRFTYFTRTWRLN